MEIRDGRVCAALYMIIYDLPQGGVSLPVSYLYALATKKEYQGRGIMASLVEKSLDLSRKRGHALSVLVPAEPSLAGYYRRFGYEYSFNRFEASFSRSQLEGLAKGLSPVSLKPATSEEIWQLYSHSPFYDEGCIRLSQEQNSFYLDDLTSVGGKALSFLYGDREHYALLSLAEDKLNVLESTADKAVFGSLCAALLQGFSFKTASFYQPLFISEDDGKVFKTPYAMAKSLENKEIENPFLNRVFT